MTVLLSVQGVTKRFGGLQALTQVTFDLPEGQILGLIGPNGAGKTTLFNAINGVYPCEEGRIIFRDKDVTKLKTYHHARMGMARTHQIVQPLNELTIQDNVMVGACFGRENQTLGHAAEIAEDAAGGDLDEHLPIKWRRRRELRDRQGVLVDVDGRDLVKRHCLH